MVAILLLLQDYPMEEVENALVKAEESRAIREDTVRQFLILKSAPKPPLPAIVPAVLLEMAIPQNTPDHFDALLSVGGAA